MKQHAARPVAGHVPTRAQILAECEAAQANWDARPGRNLVLLFDGTGNILGNDQDTNVVKLLRLLAKDGPRAAQRPSQVVYYDPGVGTTNEFPAASWSSKIASFLRQLKGLALGSGAFDNIAEAYEFLCATYREGDRIFLFGFSRGAFTARAVGGMVNMFGLIHATGKPLTRTLVRSYFSPESQARDQFAGDVIRNFSLNRTPLLHFVGVWDTVDTIGSGLLGGISISNSRTFERKRFVHIRHALSIHETRAKYKPRPYGVPVFSAQEARQRTFDQRWFRGVHSDVGGSYARAGLSNVTLDWMIAQASACGLRMAAPNPSAPDPQSPLHDQALDCPLWVWTGLDARERGVDAVLDASALPIEGATPAIRSPGARRWQALGWASGLAAAVLFACTWAAGAAVCASNVNGATPGWVSWVPSPAQLLAPWHAQLAMGCDPLKLRLALRWDGWLMAAYALWLAYPIAWALRRWSARAIPAGRRLPWPARQAHRFMAALVLCDMAENLASLCLPQWPSLIAGFSALKLLCLLVLAGVWTAGAAGGKPHAA